MFFNSKRFEVVDLTNQAIIGLNKINTLSFYIKDVFLGTAISSLYYQVVKKNGRDDTLIGTPVQITDITGDVIKFNYTPTDATLSQINFRLSLTDVDGAEHLLYIDTYTVVA